MPSVCYQPTAKRRETGRKKERKKEKENALVLEKPLCSHFLRRPLPKSCGQVTVSRVSARRPEFRIRNHISTRVRRLEFITRDRKKRRPSSLCLVVQDTKASHDWGHGAEDRTGGGPGSLLVQSSVMSQYSSIGYCSNNLPLLHAEYLEV